MVIIGAVSTSSSVRSSLLWQGHIVTRFPLPAACFVTRLPLRIRTLSLSLSLTLRVRSLSLQGDPANIGKG